MAIYEQISEAVRRYFQFQLPKAKDINSAWVGLGTEAEYRSGIKAGLFVFHDGKTPPKRCVGWLVLTEKGRIAFFKHINNKLQEVTA